MAITSLDHINICTAELARTRAFFENVLGLKAGWRPQFSMDGTWLYLGDRPVVHLMEVDRTREASARSALDHFAFRIDDYDDAKQRLIDNGMAFVESGAPDAGIRQLFLTDLNGVSIELNYRDPATG